MFGSNHQSMRTAAVTLLGAGLSSPSSKPASAASEIDVLARLLSPDEDPPPPDPPLPALPAGLPGSAASSSSFSAAGSSASFVTLSLGFSLLPVMFSAWARSSSVVACHWPTVGSVTGFASFASGLPATAGFSGAETAALFVAAFSAVRLIGAFFAAEGLLLFFVDRSAFAAVFGCLPGGRVATLSDAGGTARAAPGVRSFFAFGVLPASGAGFGAAPVAGSDCRDFFRDVAATSGRRFFPADFAAFSVPSFPAATSAASARGFGRVASALPLVDPAFAA